MKSRLVLLVVGAFALWQNTSGLQAQTNPGDGLNAPSLTWVTGGNNATGWTYEPQDGLYGDNTFDGMDSAKSGACDDNGESWIQTEVTGPGTISFWWKAYSEPGRDWLEFWIDENRQDAICGDTDWYLAAYPSGWEYRSFAIPSGMHMLKWRYVKDVSLTGGTSDCVWLDRVNYVTTTPPALDEALDTTNVEWTTAGSVYANGWTAQTGVAHDGQMAAQSGDVWHGQNNWLQTTVKGASSVSFWWKVSSESLDYLEFYINDVLAGRISGETDWQHAYFPLPANTDCVLKWMYRKDESVTEGANCGWLDQIVFNTTDTRNSSSTVVSGSGRATVYGQVATFTATVAAAQGTGTPTGTVTFRDGSTVLGSALVNAGSATFSTTQLAAGSHSITAFYNGDVAFVGSSSAPISQVVNPGSSTTVLSSSAKTSVYGQALTFTAKVSPVAPSTDIPSGTVTFKDGKAVLATVTVENGEAILTTTSLVVGSHTISAVYDGNANFQTSGSSAFRLTVGKAGSSTAVASSVNPSVSGQAVTFTATVSAVAPSSGTPTGTVQFKVNGANYGSAVSLSGGIAYSSPVTTLTAGSTATVTAVYSGNTSYNGSTSGTFAQTVQKATTTTTMLSSTASSVFGQPVVLTARVTAAGGGTPAGTITFKNGGTALSTVALVDGQCTYTSSALAVGTHALTAVYGGNTGYNASETALPMAINVHQAATSTTVSSSSRESVLGQAVTFTATVNAVAPGTGTCSGTIQFAINGAPWGSPAPVGGGKAVSSAISTLELGNNLITAVYSGDINFAGSDNNGSELIQSVKQFAATVSVSASKNPAVVGDPLTWIATVNASSPDAGMPSGTVQFKINGATFGKPAALAGGICTSEVLATLSAGTHTITAEYGGNDDFAGATSTGLTQTVNTSPVTPATGGEAISAETAGGAWTTLTGPVYTESKVGSVGVGTIALNAPEGFEFDTTGTAPTVRITGGATSSYNINDAASGTVLPLTTVSARQLTFTVTAASSGKRNPNKLTWQNIRLRPTAVAPLAAGLLSKTGTAIMSGVTETTSFGYLAEVAGPTINLTQGLQENEDVTMNSPLPAVNTPLVITSLLKQLDGSMELRAQGIPGQAYLIQACQTLGAWATISSRIANENGLIVFVDHDAPKYSSRFYRLAIE